MTEDEEVDDEVYARLVPRKISKWLLACSLAHCAKNVTMAVAEVFDDLTTLFSQQYAYEEEQHRIHLEVGYDIERITAGEMVEEGENASSS